MALQNEQLFGTKVTVGPIKRLYPAPDGTQPKRFAAAAAAPKLLIGTPVSKDEVGGFWKVWSGAENAVYTITANATPGTGGTFLLTFNGETTATIAYNATAAQVQAAIEALGSVDIGDVSAAATSGANLGVASAIVTITFGGKLAGVDVNGTGDMTGITGNDHVFAEVTEGGGAAIATVEGFVYPEDIQLSAAGEVIGTVLMAGSVHRDDVILPAGESQSVLDAALQSIELRKLGVFVQGLAGVN
jgi:hypothetical protein